VAEVSTSLILLVAAGLVLRSFAELVMKDPGFEPRNVLTMTVTVPPTSYPEGSGVQSFLVPATEALDAVPGVEAVGAISLIPYVNWGWNFNIRYEGVITDEPSTLPLTETRVATPGFFTVTGQRVLAGRLLAATDVAEAATPVVVNQALVERDFPDSDPIGKRFRIGDSDSLFATIVGVVSNIRNVGPFQEPRPEVYWNYLRNTGSTTFPLMIRTTGNPLALVRSMEFALRQIDPDVAVSDVQTMRSVISQSLGRPKFYLVLLGSFAGVALLLAMAGLFGVMSYTVAQRTHEIGVRGALGATPAQCVELLWREGGVVLAVGIALGLLSSVWITKVMRDLLFGLSPADVVTWIAAPVALFAAGALAVFIAARRAARVDPMQVLRNA
jgi:predicted permease